MSRPAERTYSRYTLEALSLLGSSIRMFRLRRRMSAEELARRAGISRGLLQRIEKGDPRCEIGVAFEIAALLGIPLFQSDKTELALNRHRTEEMLTLLPQPPRKQLKEINDDF